MEKPFTLKFPVGGLDKSKGYSSQPPFTTQDCMNVWPSDWTEGRERGGTRPGLVSFGTSTTGTPLNWTEATFSKEGGGTERGIVVTTTSGAFLSTLNDPVFGARLIASSGDFASSAVYLQKLYTATGRKSPGAKAQVYDLTKSIREADLFAFGERGEEPENGLDTDGNIIQKGAAPENCGIAASHGDSLWLAGDYFNPHVLYRSRVGDARDWDYSAVDAGAAWANSGGTLGKISEPITALFSHKDNECLLIGCTDSYYVVVGNIRAGGRIYSLSKVVGPLMQSAICKVGNDDTYFFSRDGLQQVRSGCGEPPIPVSRKQLPSDLTGLNPANDVDRVSIAYDVRHKGIHIYAKRLTGSTNTFTYWFYDFQSGGFWPMDFTADKYLAVSYPAQMTATKSGLLAIGISLTHQFEASVSNGTAKPIDAKSHLWYGPFALGSEHTEGIISEIYSVLSLTSGKIKYGVYTGDTAESAKNDPNPFESEWETKDASTNQAASGLQYKSNPIKRGTMGYLKLESVSKSSWSVEEIMCLRRQAGRRAYG